MTIKRLLHEAGVLSAPKAGADTYPVRIITEGVGSSGVYSRELLLKPETAKAFEGALSFMNHPLDPSKPHLRPAEDLAGRLVGAVEAREVNGVVGLYGDYKPNKSNPQRAAFIAEYADALGLSIFIGAEGEIDDDGRIVVESVDGNDPYKSVDIVVAAGRGGRFEAVTESYKALPTSASEGANKSGAASAQPKKEGNMDEVVKALEALTTKLDALLTAQEAAKTASKKAEADATDVDAAVEAALTGYETSVKAIDAAELLPSQVESLRALAKKGTDVTPLIESAKLIVTEAKALAGKSGTGHVVVGESYKTDDFAVGVWAGKAA